MELKDDLCKNLERFMDCWQEDPQNMCTFVGRAVARIGYRNFPTLFFSISTAYFAFQEICERIDFIYANYRRQIKGESGKLLAELVEINEQAHVICLKDLGDNHDGIRVMLLRDTVDGYPTYSLRYFVEKGEVITGYLKRWPCTQPTFEYILEQLPENSSQLYEDDFCFWNFRHPVDVIEGVIVYPEAQGFYDLQESKSLADFIVLTSNLLGFGKCIKTKALAMA